MLFSSKNEWTTDTLKTNEYQNHYVEWKNPETKRIDTEWSHLDEFLEKTKF